MRRILADTISGGEILAKDIYTKEGVFILAKGTVLKENHIQVFSSFGIRTVPIENEIIEFDPVYLEQMQEECCNKVTNIIENYTYFGGDDLEDIKEVADVIIADVMKNKDVLYNICYIKNKSNTTYTHSINVCALSVLLAIHLGLPEVRIRDMAIGALLHDIGYAYLPEEIRNQKYSDMSEDDRKVLKKHALKGYSAVEGEKWLPDISKAIILEHHERCDGSGYPFRYNKDKISRETKIVSVCNDFDRLVCGHYSVKVKVGEASDIITSSVNKYYDMDTVRSFSQCIALYPTGSYVRTDKNEVAVVVRQNDYMPLRPVIRMLLDENGNIYSEDKEIDLVKELSVVIVDTIDELKKGE